MTNVRLFFATIILAACARAAPVPQVSDKLDPVLAEMAGRRAAVAGERVTVIVALRAAPGDAGLAELSARGFTQRSAIGDIVTGTVAIEDLDRLAADPQIIKIEASGPLGPG